MSGSHVAVSRRWSGHPGTGTPIHHPQGRAVEQVTAALVALLLGFGLRVSAELQLTFVLAAVILPVTWSRVRQQPALALTLFLSCAAGLSGLLLTVEAARDGHADQALGLRNTFLILGIGLSIPALYWARTVIGTRMVVLLFGVANLLTLGVEGVDAENPWKFSLALPMTMALLALPGIYKRRFPELVVLLGLSVLSAVSDARSATALLLAAGALTATQGATYRSRRRMTVTSVRLAAIGLAVFFGAQAAILDGALGEAAKSRTTEQIQSSGSVILGGRPELGASIALITHRPLGYGAGTTASPEAVGEAKEGMASLGYDPNNGYVENYMFGYGFEVHSVLGDLWIWFGIPGALLGLTLIVVVSRGIIRELSSHTASAIACFLGLRVLWDFLFSPATTSVATLLLAVAILIPSSRNAGSFVRSPDTVAADRPDSLG